MIDWTRFPKNHSDDGRSTSTGKRGAEDESKVSAAAPMKNRSEWIRVCLVFCGESEIGKKLCDPVNLGVGWAARAAIRNVGQEQLSRFFSMGAQRFCNYSLCHGWLSQQINHATRRVSLTEAAAERCSATMRGRLETCSCWGAGRSFR
jgi:hypothetical protein